MPTAVKKKRSRTAKLDKTTDVNQPKQRRQRRAPIKKKTGIQQENISDDDEGAVSLPGEHLPGRNRRGSSDSFAGGDDDYEKVVNKRRLFKQGKVTIRSSIVDHIKKLVGDEDEEDDDDDEEEEEEEGEQEQQPGLSEDPPSGKHHALPSTCDEEWATCRIVQTRREAEEESSTEAVRRRRNL